MIMKISTFFVALGVSSPALSVVCASEVNSIVFEYGRYFKTDFGYGQVIVCDIDNNMSVTNVTYGTYNITPAQCQAYIASFITAKSLNMQIQAYVSGATCPANMPASNYPYAWAFL